MNLIKAGNIAALAEAPIKRGRAYLLQLPVTHPLNVAEVDDVVGLLNEAGFNLYGRPVQEDNTLNVYFQMPYPMQDEVSAVGLGVNPIIYPVVGVGAALGLTMPWLAPALLATGALTGGYLLYGWAEAQQNPDEEVYADERRPNYLLYAGVGALVVLGGWWFFIKKDKGD